MESLSIWIQWWSVPRPLEIFPRPYSRHHWLCQTSYQHAWVKGMKISPSRRKRILRTSWSATSLSEVLLLISLEWILGLAKNWTKIVSYFAKDFSRLFFVEQSNDDSNVVFLEIVDRVWRIVVEQLSYGDLKRANVLSDSPFARTYVNVVSIDETFRMFNCRLPDFFGSSNIKMELLIVPKVLL